MKMCPQYTRKSGKRVTGSRSGRGLKRLIITTGFPKNTIKTRDN